MHIIKHAWAKAEQPHVAHVEAVPDIERWMKGIVYDKEMKGIKKARFFWIQKCARTHHCHFALPALAAGCPFADRPQTYAA